MANSKIFEPVVLADQLVLRNRVAMSPMTTWASNDDGTVSDDEIEYYRRRVNGVGLVITGCTHVQANGVGFTGEFAAHDDAFIPSLTRLAQAAKSGGAPAILQIFHAGAKTLPELVSDVVGASAVESAAGPFNSAMTPRALTEYEIIEIIRSFADATRRAIVAGFDGVELHGAHGFLIQNFFSPLTNRRDDEWGGSLENRMRFPLAIVEAVRNVIGEHTQRPFALGYRISMDEGAAGGLRVADSLKLIDRLIHAGVTYIHASLGDAITQKPVDDSAGKTIIEIVHEHLADRVPLLAAGQMRTPKQAEESLKAGVSVAAIGQALVMNPEWVELTKADRDDKIVSSISAHDRARIAIPEKLWTIIEKTTGWFNISPTQGAFAPLGSGQPVHQRAVPAADGGPGHHLFDEPVRQLLGQCGDGELLLLAKNRAHGA